MEYDHIDTRFPDNPKCHIEYIGENWAIIYYEDEPDCQCSVSNYPGRFVKVQHDDN